MEAYLSLLDQFVTRARSEKPRPTRTGVSTYSTFGQHLSVSLERFPILTTKRVHWRSVVGEMIWMLQGRTDIASLHANGVTIWDEWQKPDGTIGPGYGKQWRAWPGKHGPVDQLAAVERSIRNDPHSRRHLVSAWNAGDLDEMALPPCHYSFQFYVEDRTLHLKVNMRSTDIFLGLPFNLAGYGLIANLMAHTTGLSPGMLHFSFGDLHLYSNHVEQARTQLQRTPLERPCFIFVEDKASQRSSITEFDGSEFMLSEYLSHPTIKADVAV